MLGEQGGELVEFFLGGQFSVDQQVGHFHKGGLLGELLDGVAPVAQDALFTVEERDRAGAGAGVHEARVQRDVARLCAELGNVHSLFVFGSHQQREFNGLSGELEDGSVRHDETQEMGCSTLCLANGVFQLRCQRSSWISTAFWAWSRFSAWSRTMELGPSSTSSVISRPRSAGKQCITLTP